MNKLREHIGNELTLADESLASGDLPQAFHHFERAHVLGQSSTYEHTRINWRMLKLGWKMRNFREVFGQIIRIVGASTKTTLGIYPTGNTGGANVWFFKPMPIPADLWQIINKAKIDQE